MTEYIKEVTELITEIAKADGQIKSWTKKREDLKKAALILGLRDCEVPTKSGDMMVSFSSGYENRLNELKAIRVIGSESYLRRLIEKQNDVRLTLSDFKDVKDVSSIADRVEVGVKIEVKKK